MEPPNPTPTAPAYRGSGPVTVCGSLSLHPGSLGASMHLAGYAALGLPFMYVPFKVHDLEGALRGMRALGIRGFGVSMPYKQEVMRFLDARSPQAERIGAVNTIVNNNGLLTGYNTDALGALRAIEEVRPVRGAQVLLLGAGGAARAVAFSLAEAGAKLTIVNRTRARAEEIAALVGAEAADLGILAQAGAFEIVVNATSRGMAESDVTSPIPEAALRAGQVVMDLVCKPLKTELLEAARARGATTIHGGRMLLHQAALQFELYTGSPAPLAAMGAALLARIGGAPP